MNLIDHETTADVEPDGITEPNAGQPPQSQGPGALPEGSWHAVVNNTGADGSSDAVVAAADAHKGTTSGVNEEQAAALGAAVEIALSSGAFGDGPFSVKVSGHAGGDTGHFAIHVRDASEND